MARPPDFRLQRVVGLGGNSHVGSQVVFRASRIGVSLDQGQAYLGGSPS